MIKINISNNKGNISIIVCISMVVLLGFTAYSVDIGLVYAEKIKLSNALDSAALAGAMELPDNAESAKDVAAQYLQDNGIEPDKAIISVSDDNKSIEVDGNREVNHLLAPIIGISNSNVKAASKAEIAPIKSLTGGIRPLVVEKYDFSYGDLVTLKEGAGGGYHGNYAAVSLGATGANAFRDNALYGYNGTLTVGEEITLDTEPGNMAGASNAIRTYISSEISTFPNFSRDSIRLWEIPLVSSLELNGRNTVSVIGFAQFYVEDVDGSSGQMQINGRFLRYVTKGDIDMTLTDTGLYGAKLVK